MESTTKGTLQKVRTAPLKEAKKILSYSALGLPLDISQANEQIKTLLSPLSPLVKPFHFFIPLTTNQDPSYPWPLTIKEILRRQLIKAIKPVLVEILPKGIITRDGIDTKNGEREKLATTYISQAHTDIIYDFLRWLRGPYNSRYGEVSYQGLSYSRTPSIFVFGEKDQLAPYRVGEEKIPEIYHPETYPLIYKFCKKAHVDLVLRKAIKPLASLLIDFLKQPKGFSEGKPTINELGQCL